MKNSTGQVDSANRFYLGIDVGSSGVKVMLVSEDGESCGTADAAYETHYPQPGFAEQNPEDWYRAACIATRRVLSNIFGRKVCGIGLSGTSHVPSMLDANGKPLRRAILWNDLRSGSQVARLKRQAGEPDSIKNQKLDQLHVVIAAAGMGSRARARNFCQNAMRALFQGLSRVSPYRSICSGSEFGIQFADGRCSNAAMGCRTARTRRA